jgi:Family of unknown function (DUF6345)
MEGTFFTSLSSAIRSALIAMAGCTMLMAFASPATAQTMHFGVRCQSTFQNGWSVTIDVYSACDDFISQTTPYDYVDFYYNLQGAQPAFYYGQGAETCNSCGGADSVDFFFMATHGGIQNQNSAFYTMWDYQTYASTPSMRLGDSGKQLKVLATLSCDTFKNDDGLLWNRWGSAFSGGLKIGLGGHDLLYTNNDTQAATDFGSYLHNAGTPIGWAWLDALYYALNNNHPAVANTGAYSADCWSRQGVTLNQVMSEPILRDGQIGYVCWANWN